MADTIASAKRRQGTVRTCLTQTKKDMGKLEGKEKLTLLDGKKITHLKELAKEHDREFEQCHVEVLNFIAAEDRAALESEEAIFNEHMDRITEIIEWLEQLEDLVGTTEPVMPHASDNGDGRAEVRSISEKEHLSRRLSQVQDSLTKVKRVVLEDKETDMCLLESHEDRPNTIDADLQAIKRDMLLIDDYERQARREDGLEEALFELWVAIKRLLKNIKAASAVDKHKGLSRVNLPKISVRIFDGEVLNWKSFWEQFDATIHCKAALNNTEKLMYLQEALNHGPARFVIQGLTQTSESYEEAIKCLRDRYDHRNLVQEEHIHSIVDALSVKNSSEKKIRCLYDPTAQHYRALKAAKADSFEMLLTVILQQKLDKRHG